MPTISTEVTAQVEIEVEVYCATCGAGLCNQSKATKTRNRHADAIDVEVCTACLATEREEGYKEGYEAAKQEFENPVEAFAAQEKREGDGKENNS